MLLDNQIDISKELMDFIKESPTAFHVVKNFSTMLEKAGFIKLNERNKWKIEQEQLAEKLNVSGRTVSRWETGVSHS